MVVVFLYGSRGPCYVYIEGTTLRLPRPSSRGGHGRERCKGLTGLTIVGFNLESSFKYLSCLCNPPKFPICMAEVVVGRGIVRFDCQGPLILVDRIV